MLKLVTGRAGSGKTAHVMQDIKELLGKHSRETIFFLVPEQYTLQCERDLTSFLESPGTMDVQVLSLERLASRVFSETGGRTRVFLNDQGKAMLLRKVYHEHQEELSVYRDARPGFVGELKRFLEILKQGCISPVELEEAGSELSQSYLRAKLRDLQKIAVGFEEEMAGRFLDAEEAYYLLLEKMKESSQLRGRPFFADGFTQMSAHTVEVFKTVLEVGGQLTITLPCDNRKNEGSLFERQNRIVQDLISHAGSLGIPVERIHLRESRRNREIRFLEENLFAFPCRSYSRSPENIHLYEAGSREEEVREVLARILEMVEKEGYSYRDITVVCNRLEEYEEIFTRLFAEYEVPLFLDLSKPLRGNRFIDFVLLSLTVIRKNFRAGDIYALLGTGLTPLSEDEKDCFENFCLKHGIEGWRFTRTFNYHDEHNGEMENCRRRLLDPLFELQENFRKARTVRDYCSVFYDYLLRSGVYGALMELQVSLEEQREFHYGDRYRQVWNILMEILDQMVEIMGSDYIDSERFFQLLETGLEERPLAQIPTGINQVLAGTLDRTRTHDIPVLFVVGFNDGLIPQTPSEAALLSFHEAQQLKEYGLDFSRDSAALYREEKLNLYLALGKPGEKLFLSYALVGHEGESLRPSPLLKRIRQIFPGLRENAPDRPEETIKGSAYMRPGTIIREAGIWAGLYAEGLELENWQWENLKTIWHGPHGKVLESIVELAFGENGQSGISREVTESLYGKQLVTSVSRLEKMAACPFAHFVSYGLRPFKREVLQVESADIGNFYHGVLYHFGASVKKSGKEWTELQREELSGYLEEAVNASLEGKAGEAFARDEASTYLKEQLQRQALTSLEAMIEHLRCGDFKPALFEAEFGPGKDLPPVEVTLEEGEKVYLGGTIDRTDLLHGNRQVYAKVMDYKTGSRKFDYTMFYHGLMLQLTTYLKAVKEASEVLEAQSVVPAGAFYFQLGDPVVPLDQLDEEEIVRKNREKFRMNGLFLHRSDVVEALDKNPGEKSEVVQTGLKKDGGLKSSACTVTPEQMEEMIEHTMDKVAGLARRVLEGEVSVSPCRIGRRYSACTYCEYADICFYQPDDPGAATRYLDKYKKQQVLEMLEGGKSDDSLDG